MNTAKDRTVVCRAMGALFKSGRGGLGVQRGFAHPKIIVVEIHSTDPIEKVLSDEAAGSSCSVAIIRYFGRSNNIQNIAIKNIDS